jgi:glucan phosphorylase
MEEQKKEMMNFKEIKVAYFSMEIGISNKIPTFSGGLGVWQEIFYEVLQIPEHLSSELLYF